MTVESHGFTGVVFNRGRRQPYTLWVQGKVVLFTDSASIADAVLAKEEARIRFVSVLAQGTAS